MVRTDDDDSKLISLLERWTQDAHETSSYVSRDRSDDEANNSRNEGSDNVEASARESKIESVNMVVCDLAAASARARLLESF